MRLTRTARVCLVAAVVAVLAACSPAVSSPEGDSSAPAGDSAPGADATTVGVIAVGPKDDFGYNQAVYQGVEALREEFPDLDVLEAYNIPEDDTAATTMESMVAQGATIIFATSYGHLDAAKQVAEAHPEVVVVHQGGLLDPVPANMGTYFGSVFEPVYLAGIAAGAATTDRQARLRLRHPDPADAGQHQRVHARCAVGAAGRRRHRGLDDQLVRPGHAGRPGGVAAQLRRRRDDAAPGLHQDDHRGDRGRRRVHGRLPRGRVVAGARGLAHGVRVELGSAVHGHRADGDRR